MKDEQLVKYLKQLHFSKPAPELRQQILSKADENWSLVNKKGKNSHEKVNSSVFPLMFTRRFKRVFTVSVVAVLFIAAFSHYESDIRLPRDNIDRFFSTCLLGDRIDERVGAITFSFEKWYNKSEERKIIIESIKKKFSPPGIMEKR